MKLGIKTTDGISKLKLKTADGISKAVPCACCDPCSGLWGPGYDDWPDALNVTVNTSDPYVIQCGQSISRVAKCVWSLVDSTAFTYFELTYRQEDEYFGPHFEIRWFIPFGFEEENGICFPPGANWWGIKPVTPSEPFTPLGVYGFPEANDIPTVTITSAS